MLTGRYDRLNHRAVDERPLDGAGFHVGPIEALLRRVKVHHCDVVDVGHSQGGDYVEVRIVYVDAADLGTSGVQQEPLQRCHKVSAGERVKERRQRNRPRK